MPTTTIHVIPLEVHAARIEVQACLSAGLPVDDLVYRLARVPLPTDTGNWLPPRATALT